MRSAILFFFLAGQWVAAQPVPGQVTITLLATTDLHGNLYPVDYYTDRSVPRGLAKVATLIREERRRSPMALLLDCGDTIQGTPLESVYQAMVRTSRPPLHLAFQPEEFHGDPMMLAMNLLGYDAMVLGNHEFNFGLGNLARARGDARFPWLAANVAVAPGSREQPFAGYLVKTVDGVKVALVGITTPAVPSWEKPENLGGYRFLPGKPALQRAVASLRASEAPDLVVVGAHAGFEEPPSAENIVADLAAVPGVDAIVFGHTHREVRDERRNGVLLVQPRNFGQSLARLDFVLERAPGGGWKLLEKRSRLIGVHEDTPADPQLLAAAKPYHELAERYLSQPVAQAPQAMDGHLGRVEDTPLVDAIQAVELYFAKADVSFASLFNPRVQLPRGAVTVRQIAALYIYENELYAIEGTGRMVKTALENAARYFLSCQGGSCATAPLINPRVAGFNYDMAEGVDYEIDLTRPEGDRIRNLRFHDKPLAPDQKLRIAVNNYRAGGSAGYEVFRGAPILWRSGEEIRDLMVRYYTERGAFPAAASGNWRIVPPEAARSLERQTLAVSGVARLF